MRQLNIEEAQTQLLRLVDAAARGEGFIIAKEGKPLVKVVPIDAPRAKRRVGFMQGEIEIPDDFDRFGEQEIAKLFGTKP